MPLNFHIYQLEVTDNLTGQPVNRFYGTTIGSSCDNANKMMSYSFDGQGEVPISCSLITYLPEANSGAVFYGVCESDPQGCRVYKVKYENGTKELLVAGDMGRVIQWAGINNITLASVIPLEGSYKATIEDCNKK